ncbi:hypothetical protein YC2023_012889 [Brassica napus]
MQSPIATTSFLAKFGASKLQNGDRSGLESTMTPRFQFARRISLGSKKALFPSLEIVLLEQLERHNRKLAEESSYAKSLASAAAVELKALSEEPNSPAYQQNRNNGGRESVLKKKEQDNSLTTELKRELTISKDRELSYEAALVDKDQREAELESIVEQSKQRETYLENELASMLLILVSKLRRSQRS